MGTSKATFSLILSKSFSREAAPGLYLQVSCGTSGVCSPAHAHSSRDDFYTPQSPLSRELPIPWYLQTQQVASMAPPGPVSSLLHLPPGRFSQMPSVPPQLPALPLGFLRLWAVALAPLYFGFQCSGTLRLQDSGHRNRPPPPSRRATVWCSCFGDGKTHCC